MLFEEGEYYSPSEVFSCINGGTSSMMMMKKKKKMMNKRRFSDEQVKSLESIFENETKLEPKKKVQLARELGLEPRQVAIWFQNKRARYKSRQLERDYTILRANYDALASHFDALKKEKQSLLSQLQKLKDLVEKDEKSRDEKSQKSSEKVEKSSESIETENENRSEEKPALSMSVEGSEYGASSIMSSDEGSSGGNTRYLVGETDQIEMDNILATMIPGPVVPTQAGWDIRPDEGLFDLGADTCGQWLDFWS